MNNSRRPRCNNANAPAVTIPLKKYEELIVAHTMLDMLNGIYQNTPKYSLQDVLSHFFASMPSKHAKEDKHE